MGTSYQETETRRFFRAFLAVFLAFLAFFFFFGKTMFTADQFSLRSNKTCLINDTCIICRPLFCRPPDLNPHFICVGRGAHTERLFPSFYSECIADTSDKLEWIRF